MNVENGLLMMGDVVQNVGHGLAVVQESEHLEALQDRVSVHAGG